LGSVCWGSHVASTSSSVSGVGVSTETLDSPLKTSVSETSGSAQSSTSLNVVVTAQCYESSLHGTVCMIAEATECSSGGTSCWSWCWSWSSATGTTSSEASSINAVTPVTTTNLRSVSWTSHIASTSCSVSGVGVSTEALDSPLKTGISETSCSTQSSTSLNVVGTTQCYECSLHGTVAVITVATHWSSGLAISWSWRRCWSWFWGWFWCWSCTASCVGVHDEWSLAAALVGFWVHDLSSWAVLDASAIGGLCGSSGAWLEAATITI